MKENIFSNRLRVLLTFSLLASVFSSPIRVKSPFRMLSTPAHAPNFLRRNYSTCPPLPIETKTCFQVYLMEVSSFESNGEPLHTNASGHIGHTFDA